jgi:hypothetical protein
MLKLLSNIYLVKEKSIVLKSPKQYLPCKGEVRACNKIRANTG